MAIKEIRKKLKDAGIDGTVKYLGVGIDEYSCHYAITFPKIEGNEDWDEPIEIIDDYDAECQITDYLNDVEKQKHIGEDYQDDPYSWSGGFADNH